MDERGEVRYNPRNIQHTRKEPKRQISSHVQKQAEPYRAKSNITKAQRRKLAQQAKLRLASFALAAGIAIGAGTPTLISTLAKNFNSAQDSKQAVQIASEFDGYINSIEQYSQITSQEEVDQLRQLENAIQRYNILKYKTDKTFEEEQEYLDVCRTICESKSLVIDTYTDTIKNKIAEAYGITDPEKIDSIEVHDYMSFDKGNGKYGHNREIKLPNYIEITENPSSYSEFDVKMPKQLAENVTNARALLNVNYNFSEMSIKDLPVDQIIDTFQEALEFDNYKIVRDADGNLSIEETQQEQTNDRDDEER